MPWRSNVGEPDGNGENAVEASPGEQTSPGGFSEAQGPNTGLHGWDDSLVESEQMGFLESGQYTSPLFGTGDNLEPGSEVPSATHYDGETAATWRLPKKRVLDNALVQQHAGVDSHLFFNMVKLQKPQEALKQPWEKGVMAQICGASQTRLPMPWLTLPSVGRRDSLMGATPLEEPPEKKAMRTPFHYRLLLTTRLAQTDDQLRAKAMRRLRDLVLVAPDQSRLGRALLDVSGQLTGEDRISSVFADAFRSRATSTLVKRSMDYYKMAVWMDQQLDLRPMQVSENVVYQYLSFLRESGSAPTLADATVKAVWFMHSTAGFIDFHADMFSSRITEVCRDMFMRKRILKQAPAFPARVVRALEEYALLTKNVVDARFVNFILFCIFSSCRVGDASKITEVTFSQFQEVYLVEAATTEAKNTATMERRRMLLPFTAVGWGVYPNPWSIKWKMQLEAEKHVTIMPARLTTAEANMWLKEILMRVGLTLSEACRIFKDNADLFEGPEEVTEPPCDWAASESDVSGDESLQEESHFMRDHQTHASEVCGDRLLHKESMVVHVARDQQTLWCGRKKSANYREWQIGDPDWE
ncbi:unnamed protein product, partial [Cladocopium goreaui]